jgi:hypothetical protein
MKLLPSSLVLGFLGLLSLSAGAANPVITVTDVGSETSGSTMPGSPSDYIFFNGSNYPSTSTSNSPGSYTNLPDFTAVGGEHANGPSSANNSTIGTPGNVASLLTGQISSPHLIAIGLEEGSSATFNYNDFNVYIMFNNNSADADTTISLDGRFNGAEQTLATFSVTPINTSSTTADFVEFNVQGLGAAFAYANANNLTQSNTDLVLRVDDSANATRDLGGVSFESVPEPSTWAMMLLGAGGLLFLFRRAKSSV